MVVTAGLISFRTIIDEGLGGDIATDTIFDGNGMHC